MSLPERLKQLRVAKGLSLRELARLSHVSHSFLADIESGRSMPSVDSLRSIAEALSTTTDYLLGRTDDPQPPSTAPAETAAQRSIYRLIGERIRAARRARGWSHAQLAEAAQVPEEVLDACEDGLVKPDLLVLKRIAEALHRPLEYFLKEDYRPPEPGDVLNMVREQLGEILEVDYVPILGDVPAGQPIEAVEDIEGWLPVPKGAGPKPHFALKVRGSSMKDAGILEGDYVLVNREIAARPGDIVVARLNGEEVTVKLLDVDENQMGWLRSCNAEAADIPVHEQIEIIGVVIGVHRRVVPRGEA